MFIGHFAVGFASKRVAPRTSPAATMVVESAMFGLGVYTYILYARARNRTGRFALWAYVLLLGVLYVADVTWPPPPSVRALAKVGLTGWLFIPWAWWIDRNRSVRSG